MPGTLAFDAERTVELKPCASCGVGFVLVRSIVLDDGDSHAVVFAALHDHGEHESWIDVILGTFGEDDFSDHVTFGCRVGAVGGKGPPAASLAEAAVPYSRQPIFGKKLTRERAVRHPRLPDFWRVVDFVLLNDTDIRDHVYG